MKLSMRNLIMASVLFASTMPALANFIGNDVNHNPSQIDGWTNFSEIEKDLMFSVDGTIDSWSVYATNPGKVYLQVYRNLGGNSFQIIGENMLSTSSTGTVTWNIADAEKISFSAGDYIGWTFSEGVNVFGYDRTGISDMRWTSGPGVNYTGVGTLGTFSTPSGGTNAIRNYAIGANYTPVPEPASMALLGLGFIILGFVRRKTKKS